jgi:xanthine dehydrogenase small subunit
MKIQSVVSFLQDGEIKTIDFAKAGLKPTMTVLNFLRSSPSHQGTKEGCAEGDCGACTVVIGELNKENHITYKAVDSCLVFLPMLHGKQLITVENLSQVINRNEVLHPVQKAMVDHHGSQCGFCTPGMIMSMFALYKNEKNPTKECIEDALTGNLCRCTGYKSIVEATSGACVHGGVDHFTGTEKSIEKLLLQISGNDEGLHIKTKTQKYDRPKILEEALRLVAENPKVVLINGATDVALRVTKKNENLAAVVDLSSVSELRRFKKYDTEIVLGAGLTLEEIKSNVEKELPALYNILKVFGSRQIRSLATLGGNIGSASPISDLIPVLMAYNATVILQSLHGKRKFNMNDFITGYHQTRRNPDELIIEISIPLPGKNVIVNSYKVSKRKDLDISTVNAGFMLALKEKKVENIILAYGGMAATTKRATSAENFLIGKPWTRENVEDAAGIIYNEFAPISDARSQAEFRKMAAKNLLVKFWSETIVD